MGKRLAWLLGSLLWMASPAFAEEAPTPPPSDSTPAPSSLDPAPPADAAPSPLDPAVPDTTTEPLEDRIKVTGIDIFGTDRRDAILLSMEMKPGATVSRGEITEDLQRVYGVGYFADVSARREPFEDGYRLILDVVENPVLNKVTLTGNTVFATEELADLFKDQLGETVNFNRIREVVDQSTGKIKKMYEAKGLTLASVADAKTTAEGELKLTISEGRIQEIKITGNQETRRNVIAREITQKSGDLFNIEKMRSDIMRLRNTDFFEDIGVKFELGKDIQHYNVILDVKEKATGNFNVGAGYNTRDGIFAQVGVSKNNLFGTGQRLSFDLQGSLLNARTLLYKLDWTDPWILPNRTSLGVSLYRQRANNFLASFVEDRTGGSISVGRPLFGDPITSPWRGFFSFRGENVQILDTNFQPKPELTATKNSLAKEQIIGASFSLQYDSRDLILDPKNGWYGQLSFDPTGGDVRYLRFSTSLNHYRPITDWLTLAIGTRFGSLTGEKIPFYERFYSGGSNVIRGYRENGELQGDRVFIGSVELRFPIYSPLNGVVFFDTGSFWDQKQVLGWQDMKYGFGAGLRLNTPLGPLRVDYGFRNITNLAEGNLHFNIGQKF